MDTVNVKEMRAYFRVLLCLCISSVTLSCVEPKIKMSFEGFSNDTVIMYSVLLDDIITTGATAGECARVLLTAGAKEVSCATVAAAPHHEKTSR